MNISNNFVKTQNTQKMTKQFLITLFLTFSLVSFTSVAQTDFYVIKSEVCVPNNLLDLTLPPTLIHFVQVNNYNPNSGDSWLAMQKFIKSSMESFKNDRKSRADEMYIIFLTKYPINSRRLMYCDGNSNPRFPTTDENGNGIYLGQFNFKLNSRCGTYDGLTNNALNQINITDENGKLFTAKNICSY